MAAQEPNQAKTRSPAPAETIPDDAAAFAARTPETREILLRVAEILDTIQYGTVLLVVQDSKVVQMEMAEKYRLR